MRTRQTDDDDPFDENGLLRDGRSVRVPLMLKDSAPNWQTDADRYFDRKGVRVHDGSGSTLGLNRPGFRTSQLDAPDEREQAYAAADAALTSAWRRDASGVECGGQAGDVCMVSNPEYPLDQGSPGHLQQRGGVLVCVPDAPRAASSQDQALVRDAAYQEHDRWLENQWRHR